MSEPGHSQSAPTSLTSRVRNYAFVMNVNRLTDATHYALVQNHELRRAEPDEIAVIKGILDRVAIVPTLQWLRPWERQWPHPGGTVQFLPEAEWRYFVIAFQGSNATVADLETAFDLSPLELEIGPTVIHDLLENQLAHGLALHPGRLFHVLDSATRDDAFFLDVSLSDIETTRAILSLLREHDPRLVDIKRLATQLSHLKALPHDSPLRFLGYFAVLEALLTHPPKPSDPYDSITRQVKQKLALLDHRWQPGLDYGSFGGASHDTIWSRMYSYRSRVAHGAAGHADRQGVSAARVPAETPRPRALARPAADRRLGLPLYRRHAHG